MARAGTARPDPPALIGSRPTTNCHSKARGGATNNAFDGVPASGGPN
jgi:hypothetical protein